jgi:dipeptidase D
MSEVLKGLSPEKVFYFFEEISNIPRCSGNEQRISDYLKDFAKKRDLEVIQDEYLNIIIKKPGSKGYENSETVIIQGHMDMVCEKNQGITHDFSCEPLELEIIEDYIQAKGTSLGGDNGIAVAYGLALLDAEHLAHPPLEVLITSQEEIGLIGAVNIDCSQLKGKYLINLDSEEEGEFVVSCAGGLRAAIEMPITFEKVSSDEKVLYEIAIKGLQGGHSGMDITLGRGNANKLAGNVLSLLWNKINFDIVDFHGGSKDNAIPRENYLYLLIDEADEDLFSELIAQIEAEIKAEFRVSDPNVEVVFDEIECDCDINILSNNDKENVIFMLMNLPNGVQTMDQEMDELVESSVNLGRVALKESYIEFIFALRGSVESRKQYIGRQIELFAQFVGGKYIASAEYPGWSYNSQSKLTDICVDTYKQLYHKEPIVKGIHAGLECGVFVDKIKGLDAIAMGPNIFDVHSPDEKLSISSTARTWEYLVEVLKNLK